MRDPKLSKADTARMWLIDFLVPPSCVFCATPLASATGNICQGCYNDLPWSLSQVAPPSGVLHRSISMLNYDFPVDAAIKALKFRRKLYYAPALAEILCAALPSLPVDLDAVLPVPLHWRRKAFRGFNQATEIAKPLARQLDLPLLENVYRQKATSFQSGLGSADRSRNLRAAFATQADFTLQHVLLIDDVVTTGATLNHLASLLLDNGASRVSALTIARAN